MTNTETIKSALIKQIIDSGSTLPLSVLVGNIDLLINAAANEKFSAISDNVIGSHITEPELKVEDLKAGDWYYRVCEDNEKWILKCKEIKGDELHVYMSVCINTGNKYTNGWHFKSDIKSIRKAERWEIIKYFPNEFEVDAHGGNDIPQLTDPHL
jgi:hypothetical protein